MWSYSVVKTALTKAYASCACGENRATAARGPSSTPTVTRTTRSSLLSPVRENETDGCSPASSASAARQRRVEPRRGRSWTCTTTVSVSRPGPSTVAASPPAPLTALCCMLIARCDVLGGNSGASVAGEPHNTRCAERSYRGISSAGLARVVPCQPETDRLVGRIRQETGAGCRSVLLSRRCPPEPSGGLRPGRRPPRAPG